MNIITYILLLYILHTYVYIIFFALYILCMNLSMKEWKINSNQIKSNISDQWRIQAQQGGGGGRGLRHIFYDSPPPPPRHLLSLWG